MNPRAQVFPGIKVHYFFVGRLPWPPLPLLTIYYVKKLVPATKNRSYGAPLVRDLSRAAHAAGGAGKTSTPTKLTDTVQIHVTTEITDWENGARTKSVIFLLFYFLHEDCDCDS